MMGKNMATTTSCLFPLALAGLLIIESILLFFTRLHRLSSRFFSSLLPCSSSKALAATASKQREAEAGDVMITRREDAEAIMERMGLMSCGGSRPDQGGEDLKDKLGEEIAAMFEEEEPSLEEVREAFAVFDVNGDGFVDAGELKTVLCMLGCAENVWALDSCKEMIAAYDEDGDGMIHFGEFVRLMETSFR